jgi:hypothetical protein
MDSLPIATRPLQLEGDLSKKVLLSIYAPEQVSEGEWRCGFQVTGLGNDQPSYAHGNDGVQALILAVEGLRVALADSGARLAWAGGEPGDHGIPRFIPAVFGFAFSRRLEQMVEREVEKFARGAIGKSGRRRGSTKGHRRGRKE